MVWCHFFFFSLTHMDLLNIMDAHNETKRLLKNSIQNFQCENNDDAQLCLIIIIFLYREQKQWNFHMEAKENSRYWRSEINGNHNGNEYCMLYCWNFATMSIELATRQNKNWVKLICVYLKFLISFDFYFHPVYAMPWDQRCWCCCCCCIRRIRDNRQHTVQSTLYFAHESFCLFFLIFRIRFEFRFCFLLCSRLVSCNENNWIKHSNIKHSRNKKIRFFPSFVQN